MADVSTNNTSTGSTAGASAVVGEGMVQLFDDSGMSVWVMEGDVEAWLSRGFRRNKLDLDATRTELKSFLASASDALDTFVDGTLADGVIDPAEASAAAAAVVAFGKVFDLWNQIYADAFRSYKAVEAAPVNITGPDGEKLQVDPSQVADFTARGFVED